MTRMDSSIDASDLHVLCGAWGLRRLSAGGIELWVYDDGKWEYVGLFPFSSLQNLKDAIQRWEDLTR